MPPRERVALAVLGVEPQSRAAAAGLIVGDLILEVDGRPIRGEARLFSARALSIERGGKPHTIAVPPASLANAA